ncbi:hypothetical protein KUTeg_009778 [Tegillarca granosa]|uniref:Cytochrome P450 n=1 Tax=Tegillarca granosa TaxID=220873 RepID=A0ABQ9F9Y4_TEGGR|nr:hypothetical protein KUTeg_009778 [Tegillarca granosa]
MYQCNTKNIHNYTNILLSEIVSYIFSVASVKSLLLAVVVALTVYWLIQKRKYKLPPGPFALPLIGNYELYTNKMQHKEYLKLRKKYGPVLRVNFGPSMWIFLNDIQVTLEAMVKRGADFADRPSLGSSDLFSGGGKDIAMGRYGPTWKLHRKIAGKALSYELNDEEFQRIMKIENEMAILSVDGILEDLIPSIGKFWHTKAYRKLESVCNEMHDFIRNKMKEHKDTFEKGRDRFPVLKDRENLGYTEATLHESMRLNTAVVVALPHRTLCDTTVDVEKFNPHRFLDSDGKLSPKPESWLPFSAGRRVCLGEGVAKSELFLVFATLFQKFKFKLPPGKVGNLEEDPDYYGAMPKKYDIMIEERLSEVVSYIFSVASVKSLLLAVVVALTVYWLIQKRKYKLPPGPFALPLIGNYELYTNKMQHKEYLKLRPSMWIFLNDIQVTLEAMVKRGADFADRPSLGSTDLFSGGGKDIVMGRYGPTWKLHRKIAGKALRQYLQGRRMEETVQAACKKVIDGMLKEKRAFEPSKYYELIVFNILCAVCFGTSYELNDEEFLRIMKIENELALLSGDGTLEDLMPSIGKFWHTKAYRNLENICNEMHGFIRNKMKEHKHSFDKGNIRDFTDCLILARIEAVEEDDKKLLSHLTDDRLIWCRYIQKYYQLGHFTYGYFPGYTDQGRDRFPVLKDRENLGYTEATLHESMRLNTAVVVGVPHRTLCDTTIDVEKFNPHRFLDSDGKLSPKPESWLPFSAGRRVCLGEGVAKPELFLVFATLLQKFKFKLPPGKVGNLEEDPDYYGALPKKYDIMIEERY